MSRNKRSQKHHILPKLYLKGFTHNDTQLFIYDKQKDEIRPGNIDRSFIVPNRNTSVMPNGQKSDWIESMYSSLESDMAYLFPKIIKSTKDVPFLTPQDMLWLRWFVALQFWRIPSSDNAAANIINRDKLNRKNFYLKYPDSMPYEERSRFERLLLNQEGFQKSYRFMLVVEAILESPIESFDRWRIYYHQDPGRLLVSDNPIILRESEEAFELHSDFVLPLSPGRLLISSEIVPQRLADDWVINVDMELIRRAVRYVACNDELFLHATVNLYKSEGHSQSNNGESLKNKIFSVI